MVPEKNELNELKIASLELIQDVRTLTKKTDNASIKLAKTAKINRRLIYGLTVSLFLDICLTVIIAVNTNRSLDNSHEIKEIQTSQRKDALCPLYQLFLNARSNAGRKAAPDPIAYDKAFEVIQDGYNALSCKEFIKNK